jgi:hypothetical protein
LSAASYVQYCYLARFSKPRAHRLIYRKIRELQATRIVEFGIGNCELAQRMISVAAMTASEHVGYTGIDLFELRAAGQPTLSLKNAYRELKSSGAQIKLVPGDPFAALSKKANSLIGCDLLVIHADQQGPAMEQAWFYVPRMLHDRSLVLVEQPAEGEQESSYQTVSRQEVQRLADQHRQLRRAA